MTENSGSSFGGRIIQQPYLIEPLNQRSNLAMYGLINLKGTGVTIGGLDIGKRVIDGPFHLGHLVFSAVRKLDLKRKSAVSLRILRDPYRWALTFPK